MRAFVTGASGFVGTHLCRALVARGARVRGLVYEPARAAAVAGLGVEVVGGGLESARLRSAMRDVDVVFHVAGLVSMAARDAAACHAVNVEGTRAVLAAARAAGVRRVVHTSTAVCVGGRLDGQPLDEESPFELGHLPLPYVVTKKQAERIALAQADAGLEVVVCCPGSIVGPVDPFGSAGNALVVDYLGKRLWRVPDHVTTWSDVRDVAAGHIAAAERGRSGRRYILGGEASSLLDMARRIDRLAGGRHPPRGLLPPWLLRPTAWLLERLSERPPLTPALLALLRYRVVLDSGRARRELGYVARPLDDSIADALDWFADDSRDDAPLPLRPVAQALHAAEPPAGARHLATHRAVSALPPERVVAGLRRALDDAGGVLGPVRVEPGGALQVQTVAGARWTITCRPRFPGGAALRWHVHGPREGPLARAARRRTVRRLLDRVVRPSDGAASGGRDQHPQSTGRSPS